MCIMIPRTVRLISPESDHRIWQDELSVSDFDSEHGYILLGDPGIGKSKEFEYEAQKSQNSLLVTARQFIESDLSMFSDYASIYIDGLDEMRMGGGDPKIVIDQIILNLKALGIPNFRIACRSSNWAWSEQLQDFSSLINTKAICVLHMNPLNVNDLKQLLSRTSLNADIFIEQAYKNGVETALINPQQLNLLIESIKEGSWPDSLTLMYEKACWELSKDQRSDPYESDSCGHIIPPDEIIDAAGQLLACMLITDKIGWTAYDTKDSEILSLLDVDCHDPHHYKHAIASKLFIGQCRERSPVHRLLADFLAARYLDKKIREGLSVRRILALLSGSNGNLLIDIQGLIGWLATLNDDARKLLIQADPITVAFSGDIKNFTPNELRILFDQVEQQNDPTLRLPATLPLVALSKNVLLSLLRKITSSSLRSIGCQTYVSALLWGISQVPSIMKIEKISCEPLIKIIRDHSWAIHVRCEALRSLLRLLDQDTSLSRSPLGEILTDLKEEYILDKTYDLRGTALHLMYPDDLYANKVFDFLVTGPSLNRHCIYLRFFNNLPNHSSPENVRQLLTQISDQPSEIIPKLTIQKISKIVIQLLARGLNLFGNQVSIPELYRWFNIVKFDIHVSKLIPVHSTDHQFDEVHEKANMEIRVWLSKHISTQHNLIEYELMEQKHRIGHAPLHQLIGLKFAGKDAHEGFRSWCMERSVHLWNSSQKVSKELASWSVRIQDGWGVPLNEEAINNILTDTPDLNEWVKIHLTNQSTTEYVESKLETESDSYDGIRMQPEQLEQVTNQKSDLAIGKIDPAILDQLARVYFDSTSLYQECKKTCLKTFLYHDESLLRATLNGFCSLVEQDHLPDLDQITQLYENDQRSYFALPLLAGMQEMQKTGYVLSNLSERSMKRVLGFYLITSTAHHYQDLCYEHGSSDAFTPWYQHALKNYPHTIAEVIVTVHNACVRSKKPPVTHLFQLAFNERYAHVASIAVDQMFTVFPTRCTATQLKSLAIVLWCCILRKGDLEKLAQKIIAKRLNRKRMDLAQQGQWLSAGMIIQRNIYLPKLIEYLTEGEHVRVCHVLDFLVLEGNDELIKEFMKDWSYHEIALLIQHLCKRIQPFILGDGYERLYDNQKTGEQFQSLFHICFTELEKRVSDGAIKQMEQMIDDPDLVRWKSQIMLAHQKQIRNRNIAKLSSISLSQIQQVFNGTRPASEADLLSITIDALEEIIEHLQNNNFSDWRQFWIWQQPHDHPSEPKCKNDCRDLLHSYLKTSLAKFYIDVISESQLRDDQKACIRISYQSDFSIPIEIKRNSSMTLWRGISEQLVPHSIYDPKFNGYGIYLILWFGSDRKYMKSISPDGQIPKSPNQLRDMLQKNHEYKLNNRVRVVVIDVSPVKP